MLYNFYNQPKVAFVHCLENKHNRMYERQAWLFLETFKKTNIELYQKTRHYFLQPSTPDLDQHTLNYFDQDNVVLLKNLNLENKQINKEVNYTNKCVSIDYLSSIVNDDYICWLDVDVIWISKVNFDLFKHTQKPVLNSFPMCGNNKAHNIDKFDQFDTRQQLNDLYQTQFKNFIKVNYQVDQLDYYVNTWFMYGKKDDTFWKEWKDLTFHLIEVLHQTNNPYINNHIECYCEEIAASILYTLNPNRFFKLEDFFGKVFVMFETGNNNFDLFTNNKILYHYTGLCNKPYNIINDSLDSSRVVMDVFLILKDRKTINYLEFTTIMKNYLRSDT